MLKTHCSRGHLMEETRRGAKNQTYCRTCKNFARRLRYLKDKDKIRAEGLLQRYGISTAKAEELLVAQNRSCKICQKTLAFPHKHTHVDHCHKTKVVRGILCANCNTGLGQFKDDIHILSQAIEYLNAGSTKC